MDVGDAEVVVEGEDDDVVVETELGVALVLPWGVELEDRVSTPEVAGMF